MKNKHSYLGIIAGPAIGLLLSFVVSPGGAPATVGPAIGIIFWMATWWMLEVVPLGVTGLLPFVLFPIFGISTGKEIAPLYTNHVIFLFIGGFLIAYAMEKSNLHQRIAIKILSLVGPSPSRVILGFMMSSYLLSMWISNTATTVMLMAPAMATISYFKEVIDDPIKRNKYSVLLLLSIAYSASIGGIATLVGTPTNLVFYDFYSKLDLPGPEVTFFSWFIFALPMSATLLVITYFLFRYFARGIDSKMDSSFFKNEYQKLGSMSTDQKWVLSVFGVLATLWMTRKNIQLGNTLVKGWHSLLPDSIKIEDATVAIAACFLLFLIPSKKTGERLLGIEELRKIPLNIVLMFGGGFALAHGFTASGLGIYLGSQLTGLQGVPTFALVLIIAGIVLTMTEFSSNTPTVQLMMPILLSLSLVIDIHPLLLMIPTTAAASFAFMLPIATPPNAVIFESEIVPVKSMMKYGVWLNLIGLIVLTLFTFTLGAWIFEL